MTNQHQWNVFWQISYTCYIVNDLETLPYLFVDDTSLFCTIDPKNPNIAIDKVNRDLTKLSEWAEQWRVTFNAAKTVYMIVSNRKNPVYPNLYLHGHSQALRYDF